MSNIIKEDKNYIVDYLKRKSCVLVNLDGTIIEPDEIESDIIINIHA